MFFRFLKYEPWKLTVAQINRRDTSDDSGIDHENTNSWRPTLSELTTAHCIKYLHQSNVILCPDWSVAYLLSDFLSLERIDL
jgi:hypothetical protein